jgi:hypothetical protein
MFTASQSHAGAGADRLGCRHGWGKMGHGRLFVACAVAVPAAGARGHTRALFGNKVFENHSF